MTLYASSIGRRGMAAGAAEPGLAPPGLSQARRLAGLAASNASEQAGTPALGASLDAPDAAVARPGA